MIPEKLLQRFINVVCDDLDLQRIKIKYKEFIPSTDGSGCEAAFWPSDFEIHYTKEARFDVIFHEFVHYLFTLRDNAKALEEMICEMAQKGFERTMKGRKEVLKVIEEIKDVERYG